MNKMYHFLTKLFCCEFRPTLIHPSASRPVPRRGREGERIASFGGRLFRPPNGMGDPKIPVFSPPAHAVPFP